MRVLHFARRHPLALLGVLAFAFVGWIWWDALPKRLDFRDPETPIVFDARGPIRRPLPPRPDVTKTPLFTAEEDGTKDASKGIAKLKPGMTRAEVEQLVGAPTPDHVYPATVSNGRVTYVTSYEADFGPPPTIRPIHTPRPPHAAREPDPGRALITLEFDATKPGHPLVDIHYSDPLF